MEEFVELAALQQGIAYIAHSCSGKVGSCLIQVVDVGFQIIYSEVAWHLRQVIQHLLPVHIAYLRKFQNGGYLLVDLQKGDVREGECAVCHHTLKLHAQVLGVVAYLHQIGSPIQGGLRTFQHHACHRPYLRHDFVAHHVVDTAVIVVLCATVPDAQLRHCLALQELGGVDTGTRHFCSIIVLQDVLHLHIIVGFCHGFRSVGSSHSSHSLLVIVHAVVLCVSLHQYTDYQHHDG